MNRLLALILLSCASCQTNAPKKMPNVIFILIDDLGWSDLSCYGSTFYETPNIDQLAQEGIRFTDAYASCPVCSPTRASILTGKHPARLQITDWIPGSDPKNRPLLGAQDLNELPLSEITFAERLQETGYETAFLGKWHLGDTSYLPQDQGFDLNKGGHDAGQPATYFYPYENPKRGHLNVPGLQGGQADEYLTDRLTEESLTFIQKNQSQPFLLYLAHYAVHTPIEAKPALVEKYTMKLDQSPPKVGLDYIPERDSRSRKYQSNPSYAAMLQSVDESIGQIQAQLQELGLAENTILIFTSDNGGLSTLPSRRTGPTASLPLRAGKGWLYEGGIRVPLIVKWPAKIDAGLQSNLPVTSTDFYPTILELLGLPLLPTQHADGRSIAAHLSAQTELKEQPLFWHFPHYHGSGNRPSAAVRQGDYKLIKWYETDSLELYNLTNDLAEQYNLVDSLPNKTQELHQALRSWQKGIGATMPTKNPNYMNN
ncbi:MAG: sulfatase [Saprospiraceae bacterium]